MKRILLVLILVTLISCDKNVASNDLYKDFESNRWKPNQDIEFDLKVNDNEELWLHFSHIYNYDYNLLPIELELTNTDDDFGKAFILEQLEVKDKDGNEKGDCLGDICDVYQKVNTQQLNSGNYHLVIRNKSDLPYLPNVIGVGYQLRKTTK